MKVLLVNPDYEIERYMGRHFGRMGWVMPPMGLLYLAAELEAEEISVEVYDAQIESRSLEDALRTGDPDVVGLSQFEDLASQPVGKKTISTFSFHPDYRIDLILFKEILGAVAGAYYLAPGVSPSRVMAAAP